MKTYMTVPISASTLSQADEQARSAVSRGAQMLELRTDYLEGLDVERSQTLIEQVRACVGVDVPLIVTCRDEREGGARPCADDLRTEVLVRAIQAGVAYVDVEFDNFRTSTVREPLLQALSTHEATRLILSAHDFERPFSNLAGLCRDMRLSCPTAIPKLAYMARHINECFAAFDLLHDEDEDLICLCMGQAGLISRILAPKLGSLVAFVSLDDAAATAPGQLTIEQALTQYRCAELNPDTELFGVIADPVGHSMSPALHNGCFADQEMNRLYLPLWVAGGQDELSQFLDNLCQRDWLHAQGFSVTIPHKQHSLDYVRQTQGGVEPLVQKIGATNTLIRNERGGFDAFNTDYCGAMNAIYTSLGTCAAQMKGVKTALIGAGGVARAIGAGLVDVGAEVTIYNRTVTKAETLAGELGCQWAGLDALEDLACSLLVNCTSIGMSPKTEATPVPAPYLQSDMTVFDTVYNPLETQLLQQARACGAKTIDGVSMFVGQAMAQFKMFTGVQGNATLMRSVVLGNL
jgi:3-dehydroquinate dehydratase / shikimate dehydrogenase